MAEGNLMEGAKVYVGTKIIRAKPMDELTFSQTVRMTSDPIQVNQDGTSRPGYLVEYPDGYKSWSPKVAFDLSHRELTPGEYFLLSPTPVKAVQPDPPHGPFADETGG